MTTQPLPSPSARLRIAVVLLVVAGLFVAVTWSRLFFGTGNDPRDSLGARAAGMGFTDTAHGTLYAAIPLALPLVAALLARRGSVHLIAATQYAVMIATGVLLSGAAFAFGLDAAEQQRYGLSTVYIDTRSAVETLLLDCGVLTLAATAMIGCLRAWSRGRAD